LSGRHTQTAHPHAEVSGGGAVCLSVMHDGAVCLMMG
jgi:hypothetical protein